MMYSVLHNCYVINYDANCMVYTVCCIRVFVCYIRVYKVDNACIIDLCKNCTGWI